MNGAILGMTKTEIRSKLDEIIAFSGVEVHIDTPVKRYSSGMYVRLAFAVAAHLEPEILIVDEVQSGFGKTGEAMWGFESHGVVPDIVVLAKGIGNGIPLGAVVARRRCGGVGQRAVAGDRQFAVRLRRLELAAGAPPRRHGDADGLAGAGVRHERVRLQPG